MNNDISKIQQIASTLETFERDEKSLYQSINQLDKDSIANLLKEYEKVTNNFKPVNLLRYEVLNNLISGKEINAELVEDIKNKIRQKDGQYFGKYGSQLVDSLLAYPEKKKDLFTTWKNPFRLFYVFFFMGILRVK